jgi:hypothetical protein
LGTSLRALWRPADVDEVHGYRRLKGWLVERHGHVVAVGVDAQGTAVIGPV